MGIQIGGNYRNKATKKLLEHLCSYTFEQECGEMRSFSSSEIATLNAAKSVLTNHLN